MVGQTYFYFGWGHLGVFDDDDVDDEREPVGRIRTPVPSEPGAATEDRLVILPLQQELETMKKQAAEVVGE